MQRRVCIPFTDMPVFVSHGSIWYNGSIGLQKTCEGYAAVGLQECIQVYKTVDTKLESLLRGIWNQARKEKQKDLCFFLAQYPYRSYVIKNGRPLDPAGQSLSPELLVAGGMPCGLILTNLVEVIDEMIRSEAFVEMPQALLPQRQLIGVFEFIDEHLGVSGRPIPDWTISSGTRSIRFLEFPTQKVQWDRLRSKYRHLPTYEKPSRVGLARWILSICSPKKTISARNG